MKPKMRYTTNCTQETAEKIGALEDQSIDITYRTFAKHVDMEEVEAILGYDATGLRIKNDWAVSFHRSKWDNKRCYWVDHSRIDYIFTLEGQHEQIG